jgi:predicted DNA-binding transcriptional regulator AlpA
LLLSKQNQFSYAALPVASGRRAARRATRHRLLRQCRASGCLGTSRGSSRSLSRRSSSTTPPHAGSSSTTSPTPRVRVPRHVARLVIDYFASCRLVVDYFASTAHPGASARRAARHAARRAACRRLLRLAQARRRLLRLRRVSGCLGLSRGSLRGLSSTTSTMPRVQLPRHVVRLVTWLIVDYFAYAARPDALARRADLRAARHRLLRLRRASGCLGTSRGSSYGSLRLFRLAQACTPRVLVPRHVARHVTRLIIDYCASRRLVVDYFAYAARPGASARRAARCAARR